MILEQSSPCALCKAAQSADRAALLQGAQSLTPRQIMGQDSSGRTLLHVLFWGFWPAKAGEISRTWIWRNSSATLFRQEVMNRASQMFLPSVEVMLQPGHSACRARVCASRGPAG